MAQSRTDDETLRLTEASVRDLLAATWAIASETPVVARQLGRTLDRLPDVGFEEISRRSRAGKRIAARIDLLDTAGLTDDLLQSLAAARALAGGWAREEEWYWLAFDPLGEGFFSMFAPSAYSGAFVLNLVNEALDIATLSDQSDVDRHLETIDGYARLVRQFTERTAGQAERSIYIPTPQLATARPLVQGLRDVALEKLRDVSDRAGDVLSPAARSGIHRRIEEKVAPAFDELLALLSSAEYAANASEVVGLSAYPGGAAVYEELVSLHTTLALSAREVHERGHERMSRIGDEMRALLADAGFAGTPAEYLDALADDPAWRATTDDEIAAHFQRYIDRFAPEVTTYFGAVPQAEYGIAPLPTAVSGSMTFGYYSPPQPDRDTGLYVFNGVNLSQTALPMIAALTYHELVPGHHLHLALQHETPAVHPLRQHAAVTAFSEGWAEYAARFVGEVGMYREPEERFGRLMMEAFLTSRLVVDTGMNALGWSLERAREYMRTHSFMGETEIDSETLRYSCDIPGQALAYKLGDDFLYELREELRAELGDDFAVADFHDAVLRAAGLPLPVVADLVRDALR